MGISIQCASPKTFQTIMDKADMKPTRNWFDSDGDAWTLMENKSGRVWIVLEYRGMRCLVSNGKESRA